MENATNIQNREDSTPENEGNGVPSPAQVQVRTDSGSSQMSSQPTEEEEKKKKKKIILIILFIFLGFLIAGGVIIGVFLGLRKPAPTYYLSVTVDPVVVSAQAETHINGAESFDIDLSNGSNDFTKDLNVQLFEDRYFKYVIEIKNDKSDDINYSISLRNVENNGFGITYLSDEVERVFQTSSSIDGKISRGETKKIEIIFKITGEGLKDGKVTGELTITASMVEK